MVEMARFIKPILGLVPVDPQTARPARRARRWPGSCATSGACRGAQQPAFIGLMTMSAADFLERWFETEPLKATMSASGIIGTFLGVRSPGTAYVLLHHYMGEIDGAFRAWGIPRGRHRRRQRGHRRAARAPGAEIRTEAPVARIRVPGRPRHGRRRSRAARRSRRGSVLASHGREGHLPGPARAGHARRRVRGRGPPLPLPGLVGQGQPGPRRAALLHLAARPGEHLRGAISFSPSLDYMEQAYDDAKAGRFSRRPYVDMVIPTLVDPRMAPPGKHVMSCFVQYAPYHLAEGTWDEQREAFGDAVVDTLAERAPNIRDLILHRQVLTPLDIERDHRAHRGQHLPGRAVARAALLQPAGARLGRFRTPVRGPLAGRLVGAPGRRHHGRPGRLAALAVLAASGAAARRRSGRRGGGRGRLGPAGAGALPRRRPGGGRA